MLALLLVLGPSAFALGVLFWRRRSHPEANAFVLGVLPFALLSAAITVYPAAGQMQLGFNRIAETGSGGRDQAASMSATLVNTLALGAFGVAMAMIAAGLLQWRIGNEQPREADSDEPSRPGPRWGAWVLFATPVMAIPLAALFVHTARLAGLVAILGDGTLADEAAMAKALTAGGVASIAELSGLISSWLSVSLIGSTVLSGLLLLVGIVNLVLLVSKRAPTTAPRYSWFVCGSLLVVSGVATLVLIAAGSLWMEPYIR